MPIQSYADLLTAIANYVDGAQFDGPTMVALAEADFRRQIVATEQETSVTLDASDLTLPNDLDSIRSLSITGPTGGALRQVTISALADLFSGASGQPVVYALTGTSVSLWPTPDAPYDARLVYRQTIASLSDTVPTNWLLAAHPDAYLFGSVLQAEFYGWNDARLPILQAKLASIIDDINRAAARKRYAGGSLVMRPEVSEYGSYRQRGYAQGQGGGAFLTGEDGAYLVDG